MQKQYYYSNHNCITNTKNAAENSIKKQNKKRKNKGASHWKLAKVNCDHHQHKIFIQSIHAQHIRKNRKQFHHHTKP
jgi:hypothetical protein